MANNTTIGVPKSKATILARTIKCLTRSISGSQTTRGTPAHGKLRNILWSCSGAPTIDAGSQETYPVLLGNLVYDYTNNDLYVCTVAVAQGTAATFVKIID